MRHSYRGYDSDDRLSSSSDETLRPETSNSNGPTTQILTSAKTQSTLDEFDFAALVRSVLDVDPEWGTMVVESVIQEYVPHQHWVNCTN
jgi:hypothetical protein